MSKIKNVKALWILVAILGLSVTIAQAQTGNVGINTDAPKATLDVKKGLSNYPGVIAPRIAGDDLQAVDPAYGSDQDGAIVYATSASSVAGTEVQTKYVTEKGYYYFDAAAETGGRWIRLVVGDPVAKKKVNWFYMPSIAIPTDATGPGEINLYNEYKAQFENPKASSAGPGSKIPFYANASDIEYYVTDYDQNVLSGISIDATGRMTYNVDATPTDCSFINIVFVIK